MLIHAIQTDLNRQLLQILSDLLSEQNLAVPPMNIITKYDRLRGYTSSAPLATLYPLPLLLFPTLTAFAR